MHQLQIAHGHGGFARAEHRGAELCLGVQHCGHGTPVQAHLRHNAYQGAGLVHHAVIHRNAAAGAPVQGQGGGPVGVFILGHLGALKGKVPPLLAQVQQGAQALVLLAVGFGLAVGILQLSHALAQLLVLLLQGLHAVKLVGNGAEPVADSGSGGAEGAGDSARNVIQQARPRGGQDGQRQHDHHRCSQDPYAGFVEKILHSITPSDQCQSPSAAGPAAQPAGP